VRLEKNTDARPYRCSHKVHEYRDSQRTGATEIEKEINSQCRAGHAYNGTKTPQPQESMSLSLKR